ncbi:MAG: undecaprenyldiphospho-muramoylpentapeptide beta-N-acetylglucosaminyltransferase [Candidatus Omnitrophota bacterium]|nr:undecaprenyldiphospho-muramoylpentapeptide beta-N-acetylglucosaminyltransferase [Candidatus Omnitrophota bacterium]
MNVLIVTGSSGGHIFPALALAEALKNSGQEVLLVLPEDGRKNRIPIDFTQTEYIHAAKLSFGLNKKTLLGVYFLFRGAWQSLRIILKFKPLVVVGFGSLNSVPLMFWAWLFRIKTIIHEQNVVCGRANRLLSKLVDRVAVSFSQTSRCLNVSGAKIVLTGNPLRKDLVRLDKKEALDFFGFQEGKFNLLITGGSQGAHRLNLAVFEALSICNHKDNLQVIHICGTQDLAVLNEKYLASGLTYKLFDFFLQMQYAYSVADLVVCRAGATTIAELQKFRLPAILIPYPFAYAHQSANGRILENLKAALMIQDEELTAEKLSVKFLDFFKNPGKLESMRQAYARLPVLNAAQLLAAEVLALN